MGNPKQKWTAEEEEALRAGVRKHGTGKWKNIQRDPEFTHLLYSRSNIDLKDKWRNLTVSASNGSIPRDKWRTQKPKLIADVFAAPLPIVSRLALPAPPSPPPPPPPPSATPVQDASIDVDDASVCKVEDASVGKVDVKSNSKYDPLIFEALSKANDPIGSDITAIVNLIEMGFQQQKHDVNPNLRKLVGGRLRNLVKQGKLEKVENFYRMKGIKALPAPTPTQTPTQTPAPTPKPRDPQPPPIQSLGLGDTVDAASENAARFIADIENKSFVAAEAAREAERVSRMSEDAEAFLEFSKEIFERSNKTPISLRERIGLMA